MRLKLPLKYTPTGVVEMQQLANQYFSGKTASIIVESDTVMVDLRWPEYNSFYIDPLLSKGLSWWGADMSVEMLPLARKMQANYQLSLNDNWTLFAWSNWLVRRQKAGLMTPEVIILHIDDHTDCMSPLLFLNNLGQYLDPLSGKLVSMDSPSSIEGAIRSGAISIGSFMTMFLHNCGIKIQLRHLLPDYRLQKKSEWMSIKKTRISDTLLCKDCFRPAMEFLKGGTDDEVPYFRTNEPNEFLSNIPKNVPVLLHIDMDYFNNRFDGDSDWEMHPYIHNPDIKHVRANIQTLLTKIMTLIPKSQIEDITVALSPGFFPVEFWDDSIKVIDSILD